MRSLQRFMRERSAVAGLAFIVLVVACAVIGPWIDTLPPDAIVHDLIGFPQPPSFAHEALQRAHLGVPDPRINDGVGDVGDQITHHDQHRREHRDRHQRRVIAREDRGKRQIANARY